MQIDEALPTTSTDNPENGLEALAQVITCEDIIGWRDRDGEGADRGLNRIVLFITDDHFHFAGEGRVSAVSFLYSSCRHIQCPVQLGIESHSYAGP